MDTSDFLHEIGHTGKKENDLDGVEFFNVTQETDDLVEEGIHEEADVLEAETQIDSKITDEDDLFGQSIAAELKRISCPRKKIKLKAEFYKLLYEHTD